MHTSQELLNLSDELATLVGRCLRGADAERRTQVQKILAPVYVASCGSLVLILDRLSGNRTRRLVLGTRVLGPMMENMDVPALSAHVVSTIRQCTIWMQIPVRPLTRRAIDRIGLRLHEALDQANRDLHILNKTTRR